MEMDPQQLKAIIDRYLEGKASLVEKAFITQWLAEEDGAEPDLSGMPWDQLRTDMLSEIRREAGYETPSFPRKERWITRQLPGLKRIAAILVLAAGIFAVFRYLRSLPVNPPPAGQHLAVQETIRYRTISTGKKNIEKTTLPDGSVVTLNRASRLRFPEQFQKDRQVYLEAGEVFFDVKTDAARPFIVHTQQVSTQVLGTSFNVRAMAGKINVLVKTGKVKVNTPVTSHGPGREVVLEPDHALEVDTLSYTGRTYNAPAWIATAWCAAKLEFHQHRLTDITKALENRFGVQIRLHMPGAGEYRYTAAFTAANTLTEILDALCLVHQLRYVRIGNKINIYGENNIHHE